MISEKTVELNLTTEWLNYLFGRTGCPHFAIAPSQRLEGRIPIDALITSRTGGGILLQYKRAYVTGSVWTWHLNRTTKKDQHRKLQRMETRGYPVFYAFPFFHTIDELGRFRRRLLWLKTFFFRPSAINPPGGPTGHHDVRYDSAAGIWSVSSPDEVRISEPLGLDEVASELDKGFRAKNLERLIADFNEEFSTQRVEDSSNDDVFGMSIVGRLQPLE